MIWRLPVIREGAFFAVFGLIASGVHILTALSAASFGLAPLVANIVGYSCAVSVSYLGNALLTFRTGAFRRAQFVRFLAVSLSAFCLNQSIVFLGVHRLGRPFPQALVVAVVVAAGFSFLLSKFWAFRNGPAAGV
jgi:putative flippase GtrA